uniref:Uncharacterized protein n=1 Tax=Caenorhabditis japonica TaxID=281687 RepID=A0A8R1IZD2_CAEJA
MQTFNSSTTCSSTSSTGTSTSTRTSSAFTPRSVAHDVLIKTISPTTIALSRIRSKEMEPVDVPRYGTRKRKAPERLEIDPKLKSYFSSLIPQSSWLNWTQQEISLPSSTGRSSPSCRTTTSKQHQRDQWSTPRKLLVLLVVPLRCPDAPMFLRFYDAADQSVRLQASNIRVINLSARHGSIMKSARPQGNRSSCCFVRSVRLLTGGRQQRSDHRQPPSSAVGSGSKETIWPVVRTF